MNRLTRLADVYSARHYSVYERLGVSLEPRGTGSLYELALPYLRETSFVLDLGSRDASHLCRLVSMTGCTGIAIDPLPQHIEQAARLVAMQDHAGRLGIVRGVGERLPFEPRSFDLIWCRDVLSLVEEPARVLGEMARVLRPAGVAVVYLNFVTDLMEPGEAQRLHRPLGNVAASMDEAAFEACVQPAGLVIRKKDVVGTEWREYEEERHHPVSDDLLKLARLRRRRAEIVRDFGEDTYLTAEASLHWLAYQLLGKLKPVAYVLAPAAHVAE